MGEIAEAMIEGVLCQQCGSYVGEEVGYPRTCRDCRRADRQSSLPRFNRYAIPPRPGTIQCKHCPSWVKPEGMNDHMHAKHIDIIKRGNQ